MPLHSSLDDRERFHLKKNKKQKTKQKNNTERECLSVATLQMRMFGSSNYGRILHVQVVGSERWWPGSVIPNTAFVEQSPVIIPFYRDRD